MGDDAVQLPGRHHKVFALLRHHQGGDARRDHRQAQTGRVQMLAAAGLGRAEAGVGELQRPTQTLGFRRAEAVHTDEGRGPHFPHQRTGQLLQAQTGGRRDARGHRRHRADALHRRTACAHRDKNFLDGAGAEGVGGDPAVAHAQHQHRPLRRHKRPQLVRCLLDDLGVPLVQHTDAGDFQRDVPPPGLFEALPGDLHPRHRHAAPLCRGRADSAGQVSRGRVELVRHICQAHDFPSFLLCLPPKSRFWGLAAQKVWENQNFLKQKSKKCLRWNGKYGIIRCAVIGSQGGGTNA